MEIYLQRTGSRGDRSLCYLGRDFVIDILSLSGYTTRFMEVFFATVFSRWRRRSVDGCLERAGKTVG